MHFNLRRRRLLAAGVLVATTLAGCIPWITYGEGVLKGHVIIEWTTEDYFVYRPDPDPLKRFSFRPSFLNTPIVPEVMYTDGGSIPRIFWSIPGLSPWGLGPAYIVHDWLFLVHRCHRKAPPEVEAITFEQSAQILAEVGKQLIVHGLVQNNKLEEIVWAIQTKYARDIWDSQPDPKECQIPDTAKERASRGLPPSTKIVDFVIPPLQGPSVR
jgi:hypothetical protein